MDSYLANDIGERNDLASQMPEQVDQMRGKLHDWYMTVDARFLQEKDGLKPWRPGQN